MFTVCFRPPTDNDTFLMFPVLLADAGGPEAWSEGQRLVEADEDEVTTGEVLVVS